MGEHRSMPARALHHLAFRTHDVDALAAFYRDVVGLAPRAGGAPGRSVWLALDDAIVMIERAEPGEPRFAPGTLELLAFTVSPDEMTSTRARLEAHGVAVEGETRFSVYFRDPEGRRLAFSHYPHEPLDTPR
jgi:catechol 2,3-dioxygenase-like lactoylglutathione lyase family enzyme